MLNKRNLFSTKILIDLEEYLKLLNIQERVNKQEELINARLQKETASNQHSKLAENQAANEDSVSANSETTVDNSQSGSGCNAINQDLLKEITSLVTQQIISKYQLTPCLSNSNVINNQEGAGSQDLITEFPEEIPPKDLLSSENEPVSSVIHKSQMNDEFDNERLINSVPDIFKSRAKTLLNSLQQFSSDLTFKDDGTIFIDQTSLPLSNIFKIFPFLFKPVKSVETIPFLFEVATKIASLGLGHLINKRLTQGLLRKNTILDQEKLHMQIKSSKHWWYLGP
jgi:hypothetical protein